MKKETLVKLFLGVGVCALLFSVGINIRAAGYLYDSKDVKYDNSKSGLASTYVDGAITELYDLAEGALVDRIQSLETQVTALENSKGLQMDLLWTNPNPKVEFPAQTLHINGSSYKFLIFVGCQNINNPGSSDQISIIVVGEKQRMMTEGGSRIIDLTDASKIVIGNSSNGYATWNLPLRIYGIK